MKGSTAAAPVTTPAKRKWKGFALALVLALVAFSLLVPLAFVLGFHNNRFPYGYSTEERSTSVSGFNYDASQEPNLAETESRIDDLVRKFGPTLPKDVTVKFLKESTGNYGKKDSGRQNNDVASSTSRKEVVTSNFDIDSSSRKKGSSSQQVASPKTYQMSERKESSESTKKNLDKGSKSVETEKSCQLPFGSYCIWSTENKEAMKDSSVKKLKDQLFVARAYYPSIAKLKGQDKLTRELKQNIQEYERMLGEAISDMDLPLGVGKKIQRMDRTIARAKECAVDCNNVDKKFRQLVDLSEDEALFHMKQSAFLFHLGVQTIPKSLHCLSMRSTMEYFRSDSMDADKSYADRVENPKLKHYVIFSRNIIAASVSINSTVENSKETEGMVVHLLTDTENYYSLKFWFARNSYKDVPVHVQNIEDLNLKQSVFPEISWSEEFRVSFHEASALSMRTEYISVFGHSHFLLPYIFKNLKKVVILDDDVLVQRDLSSLWEIDLKGKVNGAVEFCGVKLGQLRSYLGSSGYSGNSCSWMSGLNIIDLEKWREHDVTGIYKNILQKLPRSDNASWRLLALPASLLAFQDLVHTLNNDWVVSGLGHDYNISQDEIAHTRALHYNGNMKPWLELGIPNYKMYWKNFLTQEDRFMSECNVNP